MDASLKARLIEGVRKALDGDWQAAHVAVQDHEDEPLANWIHAVVHRMEGDPGNASYWYERCGRELKPNLSTGEELREIERVLGG